MTTRERIQEEVDSLPEESLEMLYQIIRDFSDSLSAPPRKPGLLSKLKATPRVKGCVLCGKTQGRFILGARGGICLECVSLCQDIKQDTESGTR